MNKQTKYGYCSKKAVALALMTTLLFFVPDGNIHPNKASHNAYAQLFQLPPLLLPLPLPQPQPQPQPGPGCTTGWTITGYYIPYEGDFAAPTENIPVTYGPIQGTFSLRTAFINQIETEATGKTMLGWYLTTFNGGATFGSEYQPILHHGRPPVVGETVAADLSVVPAGTALTIPSLYAPWNSYHYIVEDTGGFTGKHIDIFTGVGAAAGSQTLHLSPVDDNTVCR